MLLLQTERSRGKSVPYRGKTSTHVVKGEETGERCQSLISVQKKSAKRILVTVKINGANVEMELDTGDAASLVSKETYR